MSKVISLYHIVFCTKERCMTLPTEQCEHLYRFIWKEISNNQCRLLRLGGIQNHIHLLVELHPSVALSKLIQNIKSHSSGWLKSDTRFPDFTRWSREYFASTISASHKDGAIEYIKNRRTHHRVSNFEDELQSLCAASSLTFDNRYFR